jgi:hypothetical protein
MAVFSIELRQILPYISARTIEDGMPPLFKAGGYIIAMYFEDHNPPHVHVVGPDFQALVRISDLTILRGAIPPKFAREALKWIEENGEMLAAKWIEWH